MRTALPAAIVLFATVGAHAADITEIGRAYQKCVTERSIQLARGIDAADLIARSAASSCLPLFQEAPGGGTPQNVAFVEQIRKQVTESVTLVILETRASNK